MSTVYCQDNQHNRMVGYLHKKEDGSRWVEYWTVLQGKLLKFHIRNSEDKNSGSKLIGWIEVTAEARCIPGKKKSYGYPFYIEKQRRRYLFKTNSTASRQQWMNAIEMASRELSAHTSPQHVRPDKILVSQYILELADKTKGINISRNVANSSLKFTRHENGRAPRTSKDTLSPKNCSNKENHAETYQGDDLCDISGEQCCDSCHCKGDKLSVTSSAVSCCDTYEGSCCDTYEGDDLCDLSTHRLMLNETNEEEKKILSRIIPNETMTPCVCTLNTTAVVKTSPSKEKNKRKRLGSLRNESEVEETLNLLQH